MDNPAIMKSLINTENSTWLFFAPRSNETSRENFIATLESGYPAEEVKKFLSDDEQKILEGRKKFFIWGNQKAKGGSWRKIKIGDYIAFYAKGKFVYVGKCIFKKQTEDLARNLWGNVSGKDITWEYTFFLDEIRPISVPLAVIKDLGKYSEKMIVQGFMPFKELGMKNLLETYGGLTSFFDSYSSGIQTKDFITLDEVSKKELPSDIDLEKLDQIFLKGDHDTILKEFEQRLSNTKPSIVEAKVKKIIRNQTIVRQLKAKYENKCQICGFTFKKENGGFYSEVAHIKPISSAKIGIDKPSNLAVLCPNHHKMLDYGGIKIFSKTTYEENGETKNFLKPLY